MGHTFVFLTFLAAQSPEVISYPETGNCDCQSSGLAGRLATWGRPLSERSRPGLIQRIREWFGRGDTGHGDCACQGQTIPHQLGQQPAAFPSVQTAGRPATPQTREPELARPVAAVQFRPQPVAQPSKINPRLIDKIGHEDDYSWITGQLDHANGRWIIRYATPDTVDRFGGQVILAPGLDMGSLRPGDLVSATGQVLGAGSSGTLYRAVSINLVERE